ITGDVEYDASATPPGEIRGEAQRVSLALRPIALGAGELSLPSLEIEKAPSFIAKFSGVSPRTITAQLEGVALADFAYRGGGSGLRRARLAPLAPSPTLVLHAGERAHDPLEVSPLVFEAVAEHLARVGRGLGERPLVGGVRVALVGPHRAEERLVAEEVRELHLPRGQEGLGAGPVWGRAAEPRDDRAELDEVT